MNTIMICFYDSKGIVHKEFVPPGQTFTAMFYLDVLNCLVHRIRPGYREEESWCLLHENALSHRLIIVADFLTKNRILTINHSSYSPDLAPSDFYFFEKLHLPMKGKRFEDINAMLKACTTMLKDISVNELK